MLVKIILNIRRVLMVIDRKYLQEVTIEDGELLEITKKSNKFSNPTPPWNMIGNGMSNRTGSSIDFIDICAELNQAELRLLKFLRNMYNDNIRNKEANSNIVMPAKSGDYSPYLAKAMEKNYKHLAYMEVVIRIKRGSYLLNPNLFIPSSNYSVVNTMWENLTKGNKDGK